MSNFWYWFKKTITEPRTARKFWVAFVGFVVWLVAAFGLDVPAEQTDNLVTVLLILTTGGVWAVPNDKP